MAGEGMLAARPILARIVLAMFAMVLGAELARADTRVALIIGNSKYISADVLKNVANDAAIVENALTAIGFNVVLKQDLKQQDIDITLKDFASEAAKADIALFYFAGHGVQFQGQNYLLPIDTNLIDPTEIEFDSIAMDRVLAATSKARKMRIIILDARRDFWEHNRATARSLPDVGITGGFAPITGNVGTANRTIVFYSAQPGKEADDGKGAGSPFAQAFAKRIVERDVKIEDLFHQVSSDVFASTNQIQRPVIEKNELTDDVILNPAETSEEVWDRIRSSTDPKVLRQFINDFPASQLADAAQDRLDKIDLQRRLDDVEKARKETEQKAAEAAAEKAAAEQRVAQVKAEEEARLAKEQADSEAAAKRFADQEAEIQAKKKVAGDLISEERRKAGAAAAEQARIAKERADKESEAKRLAYEAAAAKRRAAGEADAARQVAEREAAEEAARQAVEAAEAARKLEAQKQHAKLEEQARQKQADDAAAKAVADACAREVVELAQLREAQETDAILALRSHSACTSIAIAADQAIKQIAAQKAKLCSDDQQTLARVDPKNEEALKEALETLNCPAVRNAVSAQIAKLVDEDLRTQKVCAEEREQFATINLSVPDARDKLSALPQDPACQGLDADVRRALDSVGNRIADAQHELKRIGCYRARPSARFDDATIAAVADYLKGRHAPPAEPRITDPFVDELRQQDFLVCAPQSPPTAPTYPSETPPVPKRIPASRPIETSVTAQTIEERRETPPQACPAGEVLVDGICREQPSQPPSSERPVAATSIPVDRETESSLPEFPWPPPASSAFYVLPNAFFAKTKTMGSAAELILASLERNGYVERSFFRTRPGGVALVTRLERINDDGSSAMASERWPSEARSRPSSLDLFRFWRGLFFAEPGHYRIIVFILENFPFTQDDKGVTSTEANSWLNRGSDVLPPAVGRETFSSTSFTIAHCDALIYEFANDGSVERKVNSRLTGKQHLEKSGILTALTVESSQ
jgi:hypothetical protein